MCSRCRHLLVAAVLLVGCGSSGSESLGETPVTADPSTDTEPGNTDDVVPTSIDRCSDVPRVTTDVISDPTQNTIDPIFHGVLLTYAAEHADTFAGLWLDREAYGTVVLAFTDDPAPHRAALAERRPTPGDIHAAEPPPPITDDRPIGEWDVAFDVVQVAFTETVLAVASGPVVEAAQAVTGAPAGGGSDVLRNRVSLDLSTPVTPAELDDIADAIAALDEASPDMVCWSGDLVEEAPEPIEPGTPLDVIQFPGDDGTYPASTPVMCNGLQFELGDLDALTPVDEVEPGLRSVLDGWLANPEGQYLAQDGWVLLHGDTKRATFIHIGDDGVSFVGAEMGVNGWIPAGSGGGGPCDVRIIPPAGVGEVEWELDPSAPAPASTATQLRLVATERACASGQEMGDRLLGPQVVETPDAVLIAFGVIAQPGGQDCQSNPATPVVVDLESPLGDREIRDGTVIGPIQSLLSSP